MSGISWSAEAVDELITLLDEYKDTVVVAKKINRTPSAVRTQMCRLGVSTGKSVGQRKPWNTDEEKILSEFIAEYEETGELIDIIKVSEALGRTTEAVLSRMILNHFGDEVSAFKSIHTRNAKRADFDVHHDGAGQTDPRKKPKVRPCLKCRDNFRSEGAHNRLCKRCIEENEEILVI